MIPKPYRVVPVYEYVAIVYYTTGGTQHVSITLESEHDIVEGYREQVRIEKDDVNHVEVYCYQDRKYRDMTDEEFERVSHFRTYFIPTDKEREEEN